MCKFQLEQLGGSNVMFSASLVPTVVRKVLRNNYQSHYLIGPYHFCEIMHGLGTRLGRTYSQ